MAQAEPIMDGSQGVLGDLAGLVVAVVQDAVDVGAVAREGGAASAQRAQELVDRHSR
jgi:hypothetical protein